MGYEQNVPTEREKKALQQNVASALYQNACKHILLKVSVVQFSETFVLRYA